MADDEEGQEAPAPPKEPFGGKRAPLFKKKPKAAKFLDDHKLAVISTLVAIVGLVYLVLHNRSSSTSGSTSSNVSGQSTAADNAPGTVGDTTGIAANPADFQPWWTGTAGGGGGGGLSTTGTPATGAGTPPAKHATAPASKGQAKAQPSSHPASEPAPAAPASHVAAANRAGTLAGLYAPLEPSSSPVHSVAATAHPASHVAIGTSRNGSNVVVPFTVRAGHPPPQGMGGHMAAAAKRPAGARATGRR